MRQAFICCFAPPGLAVHWDFLSCVRLQSLVHATLARHFVLPGPSILHAHDAQLNIVNLHIIPCPSLWSWTQVEWLRMTMKPPLVLLHALSECEWCQWVSDALCIACWTPETKTISYPLNIAPFLLFQVTARFTLRFLGLLMPFEVLHEARQLLRKISLITHQKD